MIKIIIINGPNINLLGRRQKKIYGKTSLKQINKIITNIFFNKMCIHFYQSNSEYKLIKKIQNIKKKYDGIIINLAGYSYTSVAILDALLSINKKYYEIHISNIFNRGNIRARSLFSKNASGVIVGFGFLGYIMVLDYIYNIN